MKEIPTLETERLMLRPFALSDAPDVQRLAGAREVAATILNVPHPYEDGMAEKWIAGHAKSFEENTALVLAIVIREGDEFCGAISLRIDADHRRAEMGYWLGVPHWGRGYCTEAAQAVVDYGFGLMGLERIHAAHFGSNPASGRVMQKIGMVREGCLRRHHWKWGEPVDSVLYGILAEEWREWKGDASRNDGSEET
jgi:ribosomal-protein-alanine N-acetyltransferase